jgi:hypothetical protein
MDQLAGFGRFKNHVHVDPLVEKSCEIWVVAGYSYMFLIGIWSCRDGAKLGVLRRGPRSVPRYVFMLRT